MSDVVGSVEVRLGVARRRAVDAFVAAAHVEPRLALQMLAADAHLATWRSSWGESALEAASHLGNKSLAWRCIEAGATMDLFAACALGDLRLAITKFESGCRDARGVHGFPLLHFAVIGGCRHMLEELLAKGAAVNPQGAPMTPLHSAVASRQVEALVALLDAGADIEAEDSIGATALDWAVDLDGPDSVAARLIAGSRSRSSD